MLHHVVAAVDPRHGESGAFQRLDYLCSRYDWDVARHTRTLSESSVALPRIGGDIEDTLSCPRYGRSRESGDVECQSQLVWWSDNIEQSLKRRAQVGDRRFLRRPVADSSDAWPKLGRGAPDAVLILLDDVGHVNYTSHKFDYRMRKYGCACSTSASDTGTSRDVLPYTDGTGAGPAPVQEGGSR
jgi:hypothetical protein